LNDWRIVDADYVCRLLQFCCAPKCAAEDIATYEKRSTASTRRADTAQ
jgi:hypothetical protein